MKKSIVLAIASLLPLLFYGQHTLKGFVGDAETKAPLPYAHVKVVGSYLATATGPDGTFSLKGIKGEAITLEVSYMGYRTYTSKIENRQPTIEIFLTPSPIMQEEVVVTATRADDRSPVTFSTIGKKEIERVNFGQDMPYMLQTSPSVVTTSDAGTGIGYTGIRIRGTDLTRINVTLNGIPLNDAESHGVWWVDLPDIASSVDNVQIQRGVGTSTNGAAAFGASINLETQKVSREPFAELRTSGGSFNTLRSTLKVGTGMIQDRWSFEGRISGLCSDGYIDRAFSELLSYYLSGGYFHKNSIVKFTVFSGREKTYQAWDGVPSYLLDSNRTYNGLGYYIDASGNEKYYENQTDNYLQTHYQLYFSQNITPAWNFNTALHLTRGKGYYEEYRMGQELSDYGIDDTIIGGDTITETDLVRRRWLDNHFYGITLALNHDSHDRLRLTFGGAFNYYDGDHFGEVIWSRISVNFDKGHRWYENTGSKYDGAVYARLNYQILQKLSLYADAQYRYIGYRIAGLDNDLRDIGQSHTWHFFNPKAGVLYDINPRNKTYVSFSVAHREPNRSALIDANPTQPVPKPERVYDLEAGYKMSQNSYSVQANIYYMRYRDQLVLTGKINDVGDPVMENVKDSYRTGVEIVFGWMPLDNLEWTLNGTFSSNKIKGFTEYVDSWDEWPEQVANDLGTTDIAFSPAIIAGSSILYKPLEHLTLNLLSRYVSKQYIDNTSSDDRKLDPYFVNDLVIRYSFHPKFMKEIGLSFQVNNLFNTKYETNAWVYRYYSEGSYGKYDGYFPQAGIHFFAGIDLKF